jgi:RNA polymerase sigma factor (sigma-70 family)
MVMEQHERNDPNDWLWFKRDLVVNMVARLHVEKSAVEDTAHDVLVKAVGKVTIGKGPRDDSVDGWLWTIARRLICDKYKRQGRERASWIIKCVRECVVDNPEDRASRSEERDAVRAAIKSLPRDQEDVLTRYCLGQNHTKIAQRLGISRMTVARTLHRAYKELRTKLSKYRSRYGEGH